MSPGNDESTTNTSNHAKEASITELSRISSNFDVLTEHSKMLVSGKKSQNETLNVSKKKKGKKLLQFLKIHGDAKNSVSVKCDASDANINNESPPDVTCLHSNNSCLDSIPRDANPLNSESNSHEDPTFGSYHNKWSLPPKTFSNPGIVEDNDLGGQGCDVTKAESGLSRRISFKKHSSPLEAYTDCSKEFESKSPDRNLTSGRNGKNPWDGESKFSRECRSSLARHDISSLNPISRSEFASAMRGQVFSPRQEGFPGAEENKIESAVLLVESSTRFGDASVKKTTSSTTRMPNIGHKGKCFIDFMFKPS